MRYSEIEKNLRQQPFEPFDIVMSSGDRYRVRHPDVAMVMKHSVIVAKVDPKQKKPSPPFEDYAVLSYLHITALDPVIPSRRSA